MPKKIIVVGGVAAGTSAAAKARRTDEKAEIILFEKGEHISYASCSLPYYISGVTPHRKELTIMTPKSFFKRYNVSVYTRHEVTAILQEKRTVIVKDLVLQAVKEYKYDKLIIATGAVPKVPPIRGVDYPNIFTLRNIEDADNILKVVKEPGTKNAVVIGGGLIGLEMAESFSRRDLNVAVVERENQLLLPFDYEMAYLVEKHLKEKNVSVFTGQGVKEFVGSSRGVRGVILDSGRELPADIVLISIGVKPETSLAEQAGVRLGPTGAIAVNARMETSVPCIYAAGDCAESINMITGKPVWTPLGSVANRQGRTAGDNAAGGDSLFKGVIGSSVAKIFDLTAARTGLTEVEAREEGFETAAVHAHPLNRAHMYPEAEMLNIKLVVDKKSQRLLGAQVVGRDGVDKRVDVFSTAIQNSMKAGELFDIDYAYSPPYAPAKDPAGVAGLVAYNALNSGIKFLTPAQLKEKLDDSPDSILLVDVREPHELREAGYIPGAVNIPLGEIRGRLDELDKSKEIVIYCSQGLRGYLAGKILIDNGYERVSNLSGGLLSWPYEELIEFSN